MIPINVSLSHYKRADIQEEIITNSADREVAARFNEQFGKRPDVLRHASDILELAKQGATSFHASEELWKDPLQLDPTMRRQELEDLRIGWDLIIDIDCIVFDYSKIAADLVIKALKFHKIKSISCKFSGNKGFHIGVPYEAFPERIKNGDIKNLFPDAPRKIALYIKHMILPEFGDAILKLEGNISKVLEKTGKIASEVLYEERGVKKFNPDSILQMDTLLISPRHLYRMPYSLHEKSGLVSVPLNPEKVMLFKKEFALPDKVKISSHKFLDRTNAEREEAKRLFVEALDFHAKEDDETEPKSGKEFEGPASALPEELFPPCIKTILNGLEDGRKRALFVLVNYFTSIGWDYDMIEKKLKEWNDKNREPLKEIYLIGQVRYHKQQRKKILPPNCPRRENNVVLINQQNYYTDLRVCSPDSFCAKIKNPAQYTTKKAWMMNRGKKVKNDSK
ncbi:MAG TPA: hypothetical protein VJJ52_03250 [Candidatus Nanoarchaeia archaeon]|nr:hypothetical protein [Candidatus Nanoarchaeia archaeon]